MFAARCHVRLQENNASATERKVTCVRPPTLLKKSKEGPPRLLGKREAVHQLAKKKQQ